MWTTRCALVLLVLCSFLAPGALAAEQAPGFDLPLDLKGYRVAGKSIVDAAGEEWWRLDAREGRGARFELTPDGSLCLAGHTFCDAAATLVRKGPAPSRDYVFETRFVLGRPPWFYGSLLFIAPRVDSETGEGYRIAYRFASPSRVSSNSTGFYLSNTADPADRQSPSPPPLAGGRYRLAYGREYTAYTVVRDTPSGVSIRFYLDDPTVPGDDGQPLFDYADASPAKVSGATVQVGSSGLNSPATPVCFRGMRLYSLDRFEAMRMRPRDPVASVPDLDSMVPAMPARTELPNVFSDHMVLQQKKRIPVWGRGIEGDEITVTLAGSAAKARVANGAWKVELNPVPAGGPYVLTVEGKDGTLEVKDVLVGEVWVLGGQSNMCWGLERTTEGAEEIPRSDLPSMRLFSGWHPAADTPQLHVQGGKWKVISPELQGRFSAVGYYFGKEIHGRLKVPVGLLDTSTPATGIETWISDGAAAAVYGDALRETPGRFPRGMQDPCVFYNGKVAPVMPFAVAGMIWYQGDGSTPESGYRYRNYIPALIRDWRAGFEQGGLPFLLVQIPRYKGCSPEMRESQLLAVLGARNAGLAVTLDAGDPEDIHPRNKRPMGERLARIARALAYGEQIEPMGPIYRAMEVKDGKAILSFDHVGGGLVLRGAGGFEVCGADRQYVKAEAAVTPDGRLAVWSPEVPRPAAARYAWAPVPRISLYNKDGLLASPFRTGEP